MNVRVGRFSNRNSQIKNYPLTKLLNYESFSVFIWYPQNMSCQRWRLRIVRRQVAGPIDLLAIGQAQFRIERLPACAVLLADGHVETHLAGILLGVSPF